MAAPPPRAADRRRRLALAALLVFAMLGAVGAPARASVADVPSTTFQLAATITSLWNPPPQPEAPTPFVVRRVANPSWRPPAPPIAIPGVSTAGRPSALDHLSAQYFRNQQPGVGAISHWEVLAGQQARNDDLVELFAAVHQGFQRADLEALRLSGRRGIVSGGLGDQVPLAFGRLISLQRLRGGVLRLGSSETGLTALAGVPTPVPRQASAPLEIGGLALDGARFDIARLSLAAMAFTRGESDTPGADRARGRGGLGTFGWSLPLGGGSLGGSLAGQFHSLDGLGAFAIAQALSWDYTSRRVAAAIASERSTRHTRLLGTDRFAPAPSAEDRWNLQARSAGGRAESHLTGVLRRGGEASLEARTIGLGLSGAFGQSAWYGGADAVWDSRPLSEERRFSVQAGRGLARGAAALARVDYVERPNMPGTVAALGETSFPLSGGLRLEVEPRLGFAQHALRQSLITSRLSGPLGGSGARVTGTIAVGAGRDLGFRGTVQEAAIALSYSPRGRDRGDLEARRLEEAGRASMEYSARYETFLQRYDVPPEWVATRDTGRVTVVVGRAGNGSGMSDVLVSLDGQTLRFTDADGIARFDRVAPGVHNVAIEERSLDDNVEVVGTSRVFVTVERGRVPEPVRFTVGRKERRTQF